MKFKNFKGIFLGVLFLFFLSTNNIYAAYSDCCTVNDCPNGEQCATPSSLNIIYSCSISKPNFCIDPTSAKPGFTIPSTYEIKELQGLKFPNFYGVGSVGLVISALIPYVFAISGLLLFAYLIYGAFIITSALGEATKISTGSKIITRALMGFAVLFVSYWLMQLLELVLGINVI